MSKHVLSEIWIYPIKSLGGISLNEANVRRKGLQYDRRWMLIDKSGVAMTQRVYHEMALFKLSFAGNHIMIAYTKDGATIDSASLSLTSMPQPGVITAQVWDDPVEVAEVSDDLSKWFSSLLHTNCKLVVFPEDNPRRVDPRYSVNDENVSLADAYPFLIIGQSSLEDLNRRLEEPVPMNRFRPNFVFTGADPYVEDGWRNFSIGSVRFAAVKKSDRCILTTVDQNTAKRGSEPLRTLSLYRKQGNKVFFGQNLVAFDEGIVSVEDWIITA